eukprot:12031649-Alexandrium_andersonii.AAC.1
MAPNPWMRPCRVEMPRPFLGPRSSSSERLEQCCMFDSAEVGGRSNYEPPPKPHGAISPTGP